MEKIVKYPCRGCVYYHICGSYSRTEKCDGRATKRDLKRDLKKRGERLGV